MAGYSRQSVADIIASSVIKAGPINAEYNALRDAFAFSGGHKHDGSSTEGAYIPLIADTDALNKVVVDTANNRISFYSEVSGAAVEQVRIQDGAVVPVTDDDVDLGAVGAEFKDLYIDGVGYIDNIAVHENATIAGTLDVTGLSTLASVDINAGSIDNTNIGSTTPNTVVGTTISATTQFSGDLTGDVLGDVTGDLTGNVTGNVTGNITSTGTSTFSAIDVNGGAIDGTPIGGSSASSGAFTTVNTSGLATLTSVDINGGAVDNATIGATTPSTIVGTNITANTGFTGDLTGNVTGNITGNVTGDITGDVTGDLTGNVTAATGTTTLNDLIVNGTVDFTSTALLNVTDPTAPQHAATKNYVDTQDDLKLNLTGGTMSGDITMGGSTVTGLATPSASSDAATKGYVDAEVTALVDAAPGTLDTLNELAAALGDDADFSTTVTNSIATKLPLAGGTMTGDITMGANAVTSTAAPTTDDELTRKGYVDTQDALKLDLAGGTMSGDIAMGTSKVTGMGDPTLAQDAATKAYVDTQDATKLSLSGGTMTGDIAMGANKVTSTSTPTADDDLTRKGYVDTILGSATAAADSAAAAATSESNAASSESAAAASESAAATSASNASTSETNAAASETAAATSASNASTSEANASTSETNAASSATAASNSATAAANSATAASTSASNASASESAAGISEVNAATSESNAATSESNAATSEANAAASFDSFDDRYLGAKASAPTLDNDGDALLTGAIYFNSSNSNLYIWTGSAWSLAVFDTNDALFGANNLSDVASATTSRTNLGVGTGDSPTFASTTVDYVDLTQGSAPAHAEARIFYDNTNKSLAVYNDEADITLQVGQEEYIRVYNNTGSTITSGTPVYVTGQVGATPTIAPSVANDTYVKSLAVGLATHDIETSTSGYVTVRGIVSDVDTSHLTAGEQVHLAPTGGTQNAAPTYPNFPTDLGICLSSDASTGAIYVNVEAHSIEAIRVTGNSHFDANVTIDGDLTVNGTQTITNSENIALSGAFNYFNSGDTIGPANTTFTGTGLDDAVLTGHYEGTTTNKTFYVKIDATGTPDTFSWSLDNFSTTEATGVAITGSDQALADGINVEFNATTGHTVGDIWSGSASPVNVDSGIASNRNTGTSGVGYTHMGMYYDVSTNKWTFFDEYDPEPTGTIDTGDASFAYATVKADTFEGNLSGNVSATTVTASTLSGDGSSVTNVDADTLDGQHGSYYYSPANAPDPTLTLNGDVSGSATFTNLGNATLTVTVADDSHNHTIANVDGLQTALDGKQAAGTYNTVIGTDSDINTSGSTIIDNIFVTDGVITSMGTRTLTPGDIGALSTSGKAADSNLLDGINSTQFLRSDTSDTITGNLTVDAGTSTTLSVKADDGGLAMVRANGDSQGTGAIEVGQSDTHGGGISYNGDGSPSFVSGEVADAITFYRLSAGTRTEVFSYPYSSNRVTFNEVPYVGGSVMWHSGNDGSGSGLDADLLDGVQGSSYLRSDADDTLTGNLQINSHVINMDLNNIADNAIELREVRDSTWPFLFVTNDVGNDNQSGFWVNYNGYPDMRLRRENGTVRALISSWERSFVSDGFSISGGTLDMNNNDIVGVDQIIHEGDTDTYIQFGTNEFNVYTGGSREITVNTTGVRLGDTGNGYFQPVSGNYGSIQIDGGAHNGYEGYSIGGRAVFMHNNSTQMGLYDDVNNEWAFLYTFNGAANLYYNGSSKLDTLSNGVSINGNLYTDGSNAEDWDSLSGTTPTCNVDNAGAFSLTMTGNTTFTFSGADSGWSMGFVLQLTGNGSTVTWPSSVDWAGGSAPDAPGSGETDIYVFWTRDGGTTWYGALAIDAAA